MNINLELYKVFYYVAKHNNISRAADELLISQPAISKSIKTLENQVNTKLFIRKRDGMELTEVGLALFKKIKNAMEIIETAENELEETTKLKTGSISIGASKTILHTFLMPYITEFHNKHPNINIKIYTDRLLELFPKTKMGIIDVVFYNLPYTIPNSFNSFKLTTLHECLAANKEYNYLKNKKIELKDLEKLPLIVLSKGSSTRRRLDDYCKKYDIEIHPQMEVGSNTLIKEFTEAGFGIGLLTEEHIKSELENGKLFKLDFKLNLEEKALAMAWSEDNKSIVAKNFIKHIKECTKK